MMARKHPMVVRRSLWPALGLVLLMVSGCVVVFQEGDVDRRPADAIVAGTDVESAMKAFLIDGTAVVYESGATFTSDSIFGAGRHYSIDLASVDSRMSVPLDSVVGIEAFQGKTNAPLTFFASVGLTAAATVGTVALLKALFGSCPTFYAVEDGAETLQSEGFSYSIAPLLEARDVDALAVRAQQGTVSLEMRNEALETHYINHLELIAVDHAPGIRVIADPAESAIGFVGRRPPMSAVDRDGRDVLDALRDRDGFVMASSEARIRNAGPEDALDHVELTFEPSSEQDAVLVLRVRNSLLTTVLFYDMMLGRAGPAAIDWLGRDMARIGTVVELGRWMQESMGLRVEVYDRGTWIEVDRVADTGPLAWEEVGVPIRATPGEPVRVRLSFFTDAWRIDEVVLADRAEVGAPVRVPLARFQTAGMSPDDVVERLGRPDDQYLATYPGSSARLEFDVSTPVPGRVQSYLLASQGYYSEWVRPDWVRTSLEPVVFRPNERTIPELMTMWLAKKDQFEAAFYASRVPVR